ncbi:MAG: isopentenyl phosphate kinase [Candidatus Bathyarchaeota archaeon]|uniref:isopentenyl phosphate kinase n=1 Tax=Candidatus Bathycorpusculum sp. TaxID=2994959 RepID=UPI0028279A57|nr:isopentenyl phosphate kinase [Candidatus Termiticorpusculum sp.]MCL2256720.1 isopentenyl phosphate kinase [Candidatus Termiticorpusculum sp.]MCL2291675.1 isopentenyl phosphate kinase [Candidatus Termiticorpusculum sp.]
MNDARPIILKLGGSAITDKAVVASPRNELINRMAEEIKRADLDNLIIVHGGGSFGHPTAAKYGISDGYKEDNLSQKFGCAETHHMMTVLNGIVMDALILHEIPAFSVAPLNCIVTDNGKIKMFDEAALRAMSKLSFTPVMYGDAVMDEKLGFTILSGDQLVSYLAVKYNAERIIIGVDTDGIFEADPKTSPEAKPIKHLTLAELKALQPKLGKASGVDVTGGMAGKIAELVPAVEAGIPVTVTGATKGLSIYRALTGQSVLGTVIEKT